ncbi:MAG: hypothetical protein HYV63_02265 [Candidatus Schekmanbacteria bacterium]|nr:hypothetical protein [Candidatus Schekmanbacteria bacterium]
MSASRRFMVVLALVVAFGGLFTGLALAAEQPSYPDGGALAAPVSRTIQGEITVLEKDQAGEPTAIAVAASADESYRLRDTKEAKPLFELVGKSVSVTGTVETDADGNSWMTVISFEEMPKE